MHYAPEDGKWQLGEKASLLSELRQRMTAEEYEQDKQALKEFLCGYFSSGDCRTSQGSSICPMKAIAEWRESSQGALGLSGLREKRQPAIGGRRVLRTEASLHRAGI